MTDELRALSVLWAKVLRHHHGADMLTVERFAAVLVDQARAVGQAPERKRGRK